MHSKRQFLVLFSLAFLLAGPSYAISFEDLVNATLGRTPESKAAPQQKEAQPFKAQPQSTPTKQAVPTAAVVAAEKNIFTGSGSCGFLGKAFGCPEGGVKPAPRLPELQKMLRNLTALTSINPSTPSGKLALLRVGSQLGRINADKLAQQTEILAESHPSQQLGALRLLDLPMMYPEAVKKPLQTMQDFLTEATGKGEYIEGNMKTSLKLISEMAEKVDDPSARRILNQRAKNLEALVESKAASKLARQAVSPFYNENGTPIRNPHTRGQATNKQIAVTLMLMSVEDGLDFGDPPGPAKTKRQQASSIDEY